MVPILCAVLLASLTSINAFADGNIDLDGSYSLTITSFRNKVPLGGATFTIYQVQKWGETGADQDLEWTEDFKDCGIDNLRSKGKDDDGSALQEYAKTLLAYVENDDEIKPYASIMAKKDDVKVVFTGLEPGVYLVEVGTLPAGYTLYGPFLSFVPFVYSDGTIENDIRVELKGEAPTPSPTATPTPTPTSTPTPTAAPTAPPSTPGPTSAPTPGPTNPPGPGRTPGPTSAPTPGPTDPPVVPTPGATPPSTPAPAEPTQQPDQPGSSPQITTNRPAPTPTPDQAVLGMRRRRGWEKGVLGRRRLPQTGTLQWPIPVLAGVGILFFLLGWMRRYGKKNEPEEGNKDRRKGKGMLLMSVGPLMILGGMGVLFYNNWDNTRAERAAQQVLAQIEQSAEQAKVQKPENEEKGEALPEEAEEEIDTTMSTIEVDGFTYIGEVAIPAIDISLPVMNSVTSEGLKIAPGRYEGNYKENSLIIAAHNYQRHFGNIRYLSPGDQVVFLDVDGTEYFYEVSEIETVGGKKVSKMSEGEWDLTLFTCTYGGRNRVTVRCSLQEEA